MSRALTAVATAFVLSIGCPAGAQGKVWVVDALGLPGTDFTEVQPAVDAATDGDVILVRGRLGTEYAGFTITGRSLVIAGEPDDLNPFPVVSPPTTAAIRVRDLGADQTVILRGLVALSAGPSFLPALFVTDCAGQVFVEDCALRRGGPTGPSLPPPAPALAVHQSPALTLVRSTASGEDGFAGALSGPGASFFSSSGFLHHALIEGGRGALVSSQQPGQFTPATDGGFGLLVTGSDVFLSGTLVRGGAGGRGLVNAASQCFPSEDGGTGARITFNALNPASLTQLDSSVEGGQGGVAPGPNCPAGLDGPDFDVTGSTVTSVPASARGFRASSPVRENETLVLTYEGDPGDLVVLLRGALAGPFLDPAFDGPLHVSPFASVKVVGVIGVSGTLQGTIQVTELGAGIEALSVPLQAVFFAPAAQRFTGGDPSALLVLDRAF